MRLASRADKDAAILAIARRLGDAADQAAVLAANDADVRAAEASGADAGFVDRLRLSPARLASLAEATRDIARLADPVGEVLGMRTRPNGLSVGRVRIPLGVILMIYEARPNVTVDAAALCLKSGNAVVLRGGKEAQRSNAALADLVHAALAEVGLPPEAVVVVPPGDRAEIGELVGMSGLIDLAIPRGGEGLIRYVTENARVPVVQHYAGVCHLYVDEDADLDMAERLVENGKLSRLSVCNALECVLVHQAVAGQFLPRLARLVAAGLEVRGDAAVVALLPGAREAAPSDFGKEFLAAILAARVVPSFEAALDHIATYGSHHTEVICTRSYPRSQRFLREVDASCVLVNASTRFNDGGELGLGAEMGISTSKIHAYGAMGLEHLTSTKWIVHGSGQIR